MEKCFKVMCTESKVYGFVANKIYNVKNGILTSDLGHNYGPFENAYEINNCISYMAYFCDYVQYNDRAKLVNVASMYPTEKYTIRKGNTVYYASYYNRLNPFEIEDVIFNGPATIVKWVDGTKTVVKAQDGEEFDPEKGLAMAFAKKAMGNKGSYFNVIKKWTEKYEEDKKQTEQFTQTIKLSGERLEQFIRGKFVNVPNVIKTSDDE